MNLRFFGYLLSRELYLFKYVFEKCNIVFIFIKCIFFLFLIFLVFSLLVILKFVFFFCLELGLEIIRILRKGEVILIV